MRQSKYTVSVDIAAREKMAAHALFLARVSASAAQRMRSAYLKALKSLEKNPQRCPLYTLGVKEELRYLLFSERYRIVFEIIDTNVYVYDIQDCRQDADKSLLI